jgi:hypothetical protein
VFHLKPETEPSLQNVVFEIKNRAMGKSRIVIVIKIKCSRTLFQSKFLPGVSAIKHVAMQSDVTSLTVLISYT